MKLESSGFDMQNIDFEQDFFDMKARKQLNAEVCGVYLIKAVDDVLSLPDGDIVHAAPFAREAMTKLENTFGATQ